MVLLLDRRDRKRFLFFCYASQQTCVLNLGFTYSEGGTHEETLHPQRSLKGGISKVKEQNTMNELWMQV